MKKRVFVFVLLLTGFLSSLHFLPHLFASEEFEFISTDELAKGIQEKKLFVIDNNAPDLYPQKHIPTAVYMNILEPNAKLLPPNKETPLVFYCRNPRCGASHEGARFAKKMGYTHVRVYPSGIDGWEEAGKAVEKGK